MMETLTLIDEFLKENGYEFCGYLNSGWATNEKGIMRIITINVVHNVVIMTMRSEERQDSYRWGRRQDHEDINVADPDAFERILKFVKRHW